MELIAKALNINPDYLIEYQMSKMRMEIDPPEGRIQAAARRFS